jgi:arsenate reductase (glutaredoxin)
MAVKIYEYAGCSTCRKALNYLDERKKKYERVSIVEHPPTVSELKTMLGYLKANGRTFKNLFNTSGEQYRSLKIGDRIKAGMTEQEAIALLAKNGKPSNVRSCSRPKVARRAFRPRHGTSLSEASRRCWGATR